MFGMSLGELFVSLGFDVDDQKLKAFNDGIRTATNDMLKLTGVALGVTGALQAFVNQASFRSVALQNFNIQTGQSIDALQRFAAVVQQTNPAESFEAALGAAKNLNNYLTEASLGKRATTELNWLGISYQAGMTNDDVIKAVRQRLPDAMKHWSRSQLTSFLTGVFGDAGVLPALLTSDSSYNAMGNAGVVGQDRLDKINDEAAAVAKLTVAWQRFESVLSSDIAGPLGVLAEGLTKVLNVISNLDEKVNGFAAHIGLLVGGGAAAAGGVGLSKVLGAIPGVGGIFGGLAGLGAAAGGIAAMASAPYVGSDIGTFIGNNLKEKGWSLDPRTGKLSKGNNRASAESHIVSYLQSKGWSKIHAQGIANRLFLESSFNPAAVGDGGKAYGLGQWHPDRQANFAEFAGHDIRTSTMDEQLDFLNHEMTRGAEQRAGRLLRKTGSVDEAQRSFTKNYERPAVNMNVTMHINGSDSKETADEVTRNLMQQQNNATHAQINLGAQY